MSLCLLVYISMPTCVYVYVDLPIYRFTLSMCKDLPAAAGCANSGAGICLDNEKGEFPIGLSKSHTAYYIGQSYSWSPFTLLYTLAA